LSSDRSATIRFRRAFSSSSCFSRLTPDGISPAYFLRHSVTIPCVKRGDVAPLGGRRCRSAHRSRYGPRTSGPEKHSGQGLNTPPLKELDFLRKRSIS
jgi:hypothetical protein